MLIVPLTVGRLARVQQIPHRKYNRVPCSSCGVIVVVGAGSRGVFITVVTAAVMMKLMVLEYRDGWGSDVVCFYAHDYVVLVMTQVPHYLFFFFFHFFGGGSLYCYHY